MKEVTVRAWCDACAGDILNEGDVEPATLEVALAIAPGDPRLLDLCERHDKALVEPLRVLLEEAGQTIPAASPKPARRATATPTARPGTVPANPGSFPCLWCEDTYGSRSGLQTHLAARHGVRDTSMGAVYGTTCPTCGKDMGAASPLGVHAKAHHGATSIARLFRTAEAEGDPHGIVARVRAGKVPRKRTARKADGTTPRKGTARKGAHT